MSRPDRSDAHLSAAEEAKAAAEVREYFEGLAPKRHSKPSRSDYSAIYSESVDEGPIPELDRLRDLEADHQKLICEGGGVVEEEHVETEYYKDLNCVGKQHHTTGTGFIKVEESNGVSFHLGSVTDAADHHGHCKGNPATNDWTPSADTVIPVSVKPNRSDI